MLQIWCGDALGRPPLVGCLLDHFESLKSILVARAEGNPISAAPEACIRDYRRYRELQTA